MGKSFKTFAGTIKKYAFCAVVVDINFSSIHLTYHLLHSRHLARMGPLPPPTPDMGPD